MLIPSSSAHAFRRTTDFSEHGVGAISGWTLVLDNGGTTDASFISDSGLGGISFFHNWVNQYDKIWSYDEVGHLIDSDWDQVCVIEADDMTDAYSGLAGCVEDAGISTSGFAEAYILMVSNGGLDIVKQFVGGFTNKDSAVFATPNNTRICLRFRKEGATLKGKAWLYGDPEPGAWMVEWTDTDTGSPDIYDDGYCGIRAFGGPTNVDTTHAYYSIALHGAPAIAPP